MSPRKRSIAHHLTTLEFAPRGNSEDYASIVQNHVEAERALVRLGAVGDVVEWARAELVRDDSDDLVEFILTASAAATNGGGS